MGRHRIYTDEELAAHRRAYWREYYRAHREEILEKNRKWSREHRREAYDRRLAKLGKSRRPVLTPEERAERNRILGREQDRRWRARKLAADPEGFRRRNAERARAFRLRRKAERETIGSSGEYPEREERIHVD